MIRQQQIPSFAAFVRRITPLFVITTTVILLQCVSVSLALQATSIPPLIDVPTFSLSTLGRRSKDDSSSGNSSDDAGDNNNCSISSPKNTMNILTYASPISVQPHRMWSIGLYKGTMSHENFARERRGVLQLLRPEHANVCGKENGVAGELIRVLGGSSGRDVDKENACAGLGYKWTSLDNYHLQNEEPHGGGGEEDDSQIIEWPQILPSCIYYLKLELVGELIDCGSHEVALCKVVSMISDDGVQTASELDYLSTRKLRDMGIISEFGRVVPMESKE